MDVFNVSRNIYIPLINRPAFQSNNSERIEKLRKEESEFQSFFLVFLCSLNISGGRGGGKSYYSLRRWSKIFNCGREGDENRRVDFPSRPESTEPHGALGFTRVYAHVRQVGHGCFGVSWSPWPPWSVCPWRRRMMIHCMCRLHLPSCVLGLVNLACSVVGCRTTSSRCPSHLQSRVGCSSYGSWPSSVSLGPARGWCRRWSSYRRSVVESCSCGCRSRPIRYDGSLRMRPWYRMDCVWKNKIKSQNVKK